MSDPINAYAVLGIDPRDDKGKWLTVPPSVIQSALVVAIAANHPMLARHPEPDALERCERAHLAALVLLGNEREAHDAAIKVGANYTTELRGDDFSGVDPVPWLIAYAVDTGAEVCQYLPAFIAAERLANVERLGLAEAWAAAKEQIELIADDVKAPSAERVIADDLGRWLRRCPHGIEFVFRASDWRLSGESKKLTPAALATYAGNPHAAPLGRVTLSLRAWLRAGREERERLMFRHLWAFSPSYNNDKREWSLKVRRPDVEEYSAAVRVFGPMGSAQTAMVVHGAIHEITPKRVELFHSAIYEGAQAVLFERVAR